MNGGKRGVQGADALRNSCECGRVTPGESQRAGPCLLFGLFIMGQFECCVADRRSDARVDLGGD